MKLAAVLVLVLAVSLHVSLVSAKGGPCSALKLPAVQKSKTFDLSSLAGQTFSATAQSDGGSTTFNWAICESIACDGKTAGTCQTVVTGGSSYTGVAALWDPNNVVAIAPDGGALGIGVQETNTFGRLINILVLCDPKAKTGSNPTAVLPTNSGAPTILAISHVSGCGKKGGLSGGSICLIILTVCLVLYFVCGFLYKRYRLGNEGFEAVPNYLWADLPGLVKDGFIFVKNKTCGGGNYETV